MSNISFMPVKAIGTFIGIPISVPIQDRLEYRDNNKTEVFSRVSLLMGYGSGGHPLIEVRDYNYCIAKYLFEGHSVPIIEKYYSNYFNMSNWCLNFIGWSLDEVVWFGNKIKILSENSEDIHEWFIVEIGRFAFNYLSDIDPHYSEIRSKIGRFVDPGNELICPIYDAEKPDLIAH